jgi:hypothetical protein
MKVLGMGAKKYPYKPECGRSQREKKMQAGDKF